MLQQDVDVKETEVEVNLEDIEVMYVESPNGPEGSPEAFARLEGKLSSLKGRKFYATFQYPDGPYRACGALIPSDKPKDLGIDTWVIPGGEYAQGKLDDWAKHPWDIPGAFTRLSEAYLEKIDPSRPSIEFYKSQRELILLIPIKKDD